MCWSTWTCGVCLPLETGTQALQHSTDLTLLIRSDPTVNPELVFIDPHDLVRRAEFHHNVALSDLVGVGRAMKQEKAGHDGYDEGSNKLRHHPYRLPQRMHGRLYPNAAIDGTPSSWRH